MVLENRRNAIDVHGWNPQDTPFLMTTTSLRRACMCDRVQNPFEDTFSMSCGDVTLLSVTYEDLCIIGLYIVKLSVRSKP